jgi:hypothetical protein
MSQNNGSDTLISWLHWMAATAAFRHVKTTTPTESYRNSGLDAGAEPMVDRRQVGCETV